MIYKDRINIFEALSLAGDISAYGNRQKVTVNKTIAIWSDGQRIFSCRQKYFDIRILLCNAERYHLYHSNAREIIPG